MIGPLLLLKQKKKKTVWAILLQHRQKLILKIHKTGILYGLMDRFLWFILRMETKYILKICLLILMEIMLS